MSLPDVLLRVTIISVTMKVVFITLGFALVWLGVRLGRRVYRHDIPRRQYVQELGPALVVVAFDIAVLFAFRALFIDRFEAPTLVSIAVSFVWMFVSFEVWFYVSHRLLHTKALYRFHAQHHVAHVVDPLTSVSFGLVERAVLLGGALALALVGTAFLPMANEGMLLYVALNYALNVLGHSNVEILPRWVARTPFYTPTFHAMHHARYDGHYGLFTTVLDRAFATAWPDYLDVHARARAGAGLERLGERLHSFPHEPVES